MKCPDCKHIFKYSSVPSCFRFKKMWYSIFLCPNCEVLLVPTKIFSYYTGSGLILIIISFLSYLFELYEYSNLFNWLIPGYFIAGISLYVYGVLTVKLKMCTENDL